MTLKECIPGMRVVVTASETIFGHPLVEGIPGAHGRITELTNIRRGEVWVELDNEVKQAGGRKRFMFFAASLSPEDNFVLAWDES